MLPAFVFIERDYFLFIRYLNKHFMNLISKQKNLVFMYIHKSEFEDETSVKLKNLTEKPVLLVQEERLSEIENLEAPTEKRFTDGALSASFTIKKDDVVYTSSDFDHQNPPKELKELYQFLEEFSS